jgi:DNA mismatch repair protein MutL
MEDIIKLLPDVIANQIAAGEVVQRPASVVKELLENAVDAGATRIQLIVKDAGKTWIQVIDNGCGMSDTDARMSFERHATSKIRTADDLFHIRTMGFRGEALASIAAVAQVEMRSRKAESKVGTQIIIEGGDFISQETVSTAEGTSITVKNLFYNVPARRNFLKSNTSESRHIIDEFQRVAMAHPQIAFTFHHNGAELFHLKEGNLRQRVVALFGNPYNERLVPIEENTTVIKIYGFIGKPDTAKKMRGEQFIFVNNRFIKSHYLHHAIVTAYDEMIPSDAHPLYTLFLEIDPSRIDVNVHPTKQEIKFDDEKIIYTFVHTAVKHSLGKYSVTPTLDFDQETAFSRMSSAIASQHKEEPAPTAFNATIESPAKSVSAAGSSYWKNLYEEVKQNRQSVYTIPSKWEQEERALFNQEEHNEELPVAFQIHNCYILSQIKSGYIIADQQAAHERVLFDKYLKYLSGQKNSTQQQLFPQQMTLTHSDAQMLEDVMPELKQLGFDIHPFGGSTFVIHGAPPEVLSGQEPEALEKILDAYKQNGQQLKHNKREAIAQAFAKVNCIKHGKTLGEKECRHLLDELFASENPYYTPDGTPTFITYSLKDLEKQFSGKS